MSFLLQLFFFLNPFHHSQLSCYALPPKTFPHLAVFFQSHVACLSFRTPSTFPLSLNVSADPALNILLCPSAYLPNRPTVSNPQAEPCHHCTPRAWHGAWMGAMKVVILRKGQGEKEGNWDMYICVHAWCLSGDIYSSLFPERL